MSIADILGLPLPIWLGWFLVMEISALIDTFLLDHYEINLSNDNKRFYLINFGLTALVYPIGVGIEVYGTRQKIWNYTTIPSPSIAGIPILILIGWFVFMYVVVTLEARSIRKEKLEEKQFNLNYQDIVI